MDLQEKAEIFSASARLASVAKGMQQMADGRPVEERILQYFQWAGELTGQMDWDSEHYNQHPELCGIATTFRPIFYRALRLHQVPFNPDLSERLYTTLTSRGTEVRLTPGELNQVRQVYHDLSMGALNEISPGGQI